MMASWMLYMLSVGALLTAAAFVAERVLVARGKPTRFVWAVSLALSVAWPLGPAIARLLPAPTRAVTVLPFRIVVEAPVISAMESAAIARAQSIDRGLVVVWIVLSLVLIVRIASAMRIVDRSRSAWKRGRVNGVRVKLSDNVGPAVVGLRTMDVVLPEWILSLDEPLRAIVLRHEEEHRTARDPYLLFGAAIVGAFMPWNVALWIQARRLRLAVEMDCDARVLRAHPSPERYGMLILTIAQRRGAAPTMFAPMLSEPTTNLERRILAMRSTGQRLARLTVYGGSVVTIGLLAFASSLQSAGMTFPHSPVPNAIAKAASVILPMPTIATETIPPKRKTVTVMASPGRDTATVRTLQPVQSTPTGAMPTENRAPRYPDMLRSANIEGTVVARFSSDASGRVIPETIEIEKSTHDLFTNSVKQAISTWRVPPGTTTTMPFVFALSAERSAEISAASGVRNAVVTLSPDYGTMRVPPQEANSDQTYFEFQVEKQVSAFPGNPGPRYPMDLRTLGVEGEVLMQFVVGLDGRADPRTYKVLKSTHDEFTTAVIAVLPQMQFYPAQVGGLPVKQLVQMPFGFALTK